MKKLIAAIALIASLSPAHAQNVSAYASLNNQKNQQWDKFLLYASKTSARQFGKVQYNRVCNPQTKTCNEGIFYYDGKGLQTLARESLNIAGKVISRDVCRFNPAGDIRICVDWDSEETSTHMQNAKGEWYIVE